MSDSLLSTEEQRLWHGFKRASEHVLSNVGRDLSAATGLSAADFAVLSRLVDLGAGALRQQELANSMHWDKSRLSHHLTRMVERGLVTRVSLADAVQVAITAAGKRALQPARAAHASAIRQHLLAKLSAHERRTLAALLEKIEAAR